MISPSPQPGEANSATKRPGSLVVLVKMLGDRKPLLVVAIILSIVGSVFGLVQPALVNRIVDMVGTSNGQTGLLLWTLATVVVGMAVVGAIEFYILGRIAETAVYRTRVELVGRILRLPIARHDVLRNGDLVSRVGSDTTLIRSAFSNGLINMISSITTMLGAIIMMAVVDWVMLLVVLGVVVIVMVGVLTISGVVQRDTARAQASVGQLGADLEQALGALRTIRSAGATERVEQRLIASAKRTLSTSLKIARTEAIIFPFSGLALQASFLIVLGVGGARVASGQMSVGELVSFVLYLFLVAMPLADIFGAVTTVRSAMGAIDRIREVGDEHEERVGGISVERIGNIEFKHVSFSYPTGVQALDDANFRIPEGKTTALVGPSGAGKSTVVALLEQFYQPHQGRVLLGGLDSSELDVRSIRARMGYVEQEAALIAGTIRENLQLVQQDVTDAQCWEALECVNLAERMRSADGLDTVLGDRGLSLSGGQRQRLALARMLLMDAEVLILDEPTSSVDSQNERIIMDSIANISSGKTVIIVAHRLSTVVSADQILVLDQGSVVTSGTHDELLDSSDLYRDLARRQLLV
nr:ABC transporter ATP-binding protein [Corynebacterium lactis]